MCNLKYSIPKEIAVVCHNESTYNYHFFIKEVAKEFEGELNYLGEDTAKYKLFSVSIAKEVKRTGTNGE